jgi:soluble lytic murein transglycosylase-like protein
MRILLPALLAGILLLQAMPALSPVGPAHAASAVLNAAEAPGLMCRRAIAAAERTQDIPPHLLAAIARVESGRRDPASGAMHPWPWTINAEGEGHFFDTAAQAIAAVKALQAQGMRSIDVGCMQVNLLHHPNAFATLEQAFDPPANAAYAARFLRELFDQTGSWPKAAGLYHSTTAELAEPYRQQVLALWPEEARSQTAVAAPVATAWAATLHALPPLQRGIPVRIIPLSRGPDGALPAGRDLASYRAIPVFGRASLLPGR